MHNLGLGLNSWLRFRGFGVSGCGGGRDRERIGGQTLVGVSETRGP